MPSTFGVLAERTAELYGLVGFLVGEGLSTWHYPKTQRF
jgi:hypothetical protein